ncbi:MAG: hypothetical protein A2418_02080 [Candidatus Brennerbacteria bacterium RIFOXYC1_FULL_41_11]|uniref:Uncharacterized protein n=1 Tax=Candidatus Brennerbacteria bacterium RIFOXYD1_FULL_41_16 TaxID=1797529 RepID=A0A1G1XN33_9BACT|nr:MAG: hypothetical protein A2391_01435 [Candidatus Brennerbacteria bacterium RIFOXYB1_FULL_41_13]OGY39936.1 MAG: hypothetical protein A2418_02080 [Candidatus Brennerbacteria bacterium RIFOXYC1_FULL_41_11]OGY40747.1 MAG: hypothetical protein A2570_01295 [Candidatus Brennerbacteria bacterium RIFOXYD1_FULL_41_16]
MDQIILQCRKCDKKMHLIVESMPGKLDELYKKFGDNWLTLLKAQDGELTRDFLDEVEHHQKICDGIVVLRK